MLSHLLAMLRSLWRCRAFMRATVEREFRTRYARSALGPVWLVLPSLAQITIFTVVFSALMRPSLAGMEGDRYAYSVYLCAGVICWGLFAEIVSRMSLVFIEHAAVIRKTNIPRASFPLICAASALLNFAVLMALFLLFLLLVGKFPGGEILYLIPVLAVQVLLASALGVVVGVVNVFLRDLGHMVTVVLQFGFWLTPVVYSINVLPERVASLLQFNPMWPIVSAYQNIFVWQQAPSWAGLGYALGLALGLSALAALTFHRMGADMVDEL